MSFCSPLRISERASLCPGLLWGTQMPLGAPTHDSPKQGLQLWVVTTGSQSQTPILVCFPTGVNGVQKEARRHRDKRVISRCTERYLHIWGAPRICDPHGLLATSECPSGLLRMVRAWKGMPSSYQGKAN